MKISDMDTGDVAAIQGAMADLRAQVDALAVKSIDWRDESNMPPVPSRTERGTPYRSFSSGQAHDALATHAPFTGTLQELVEATLDAITGYRNSIGRPVDVVWRDGPLYERYAPESGRGHSIWVRLAFEPVAVEAQAEPVVSLAEVRAFQAGNAELWTPVDALRSLLRRIEAGEVNPERLAIHTIHRDAAGGLTHGFTVAGLTFETHLCLLEIAKQRLMDDWRR